MLFAYFVCTFLHELISKLYVPVYILCTGLYFLYLQDVNVYCSAQVVALESFNYEEESDTNFTISVVDSGNLTVKRTFQLSILNRNDKPSVSYLIETKNSAESFCLDTR